MNVRLTDVAASSLRSVAVAIWRVQVPRAKVMSARVNAALSLVVPVYLPGLRRKKKPMQIISAMVARSAGDPPGA